MPSSPQLSSQFVFGPGAASNGDILQFRDVHNQIVSWIDDQGYAWGNLGSLPVAGANFADQETPAGSGTNFTLAHSPNPVASLLLFWNGILLSSEIDFTLSGNALTLTQSVSGTDQFVCWYRY
jgi:hypothetical protein